MQDTASSQAYPECSTPQRDRLTSHLRRYALIGLFVSAGLLPRGVRAGPAAGRHRRQAGRARNRRGRRVRRPLRGGRRGGHPLARRRLSRPGPLPGRRARQQGRPAVHHRPAALPGGLRRGQVAGRRRHQPARLLQDAARPRRGAGQVRQHLRPPPSTTAGANIWRRRRRCRARRRRCARPSLDLEFTEIKAPLAGRIDRRLGVGRQSRPGRTQTHADHDRRRSIRSTSISTSTSASISPMRATPGARRHHAGRRRRPRRDGAGRRPRRRTAFKGKLDFAENRIDNATGTMRVRARFPNPDGVLQPGMFGRVNVPGSLPHPGVLVPDEAIGADQDRRIVLRGRRRRHGLGQAGAHRPAHRRLPRHPRGPDRRRDRHRQRPDARAGPASRSRPRW